MKPFSMEDKVMSVDKCEWMEDNEYVKNDPYIDDCIEIVWREGDSPKYYNLYELHGYKYIEKFDAVIMYGHEEIIIFNEHEKLVHIYTR